MDRKVPDIDSVMYKLYEYADQNYNGDLLSHAYPAFMSLDTLEQRVFMRHAMAHHIRRFEEKHFSREGTQNSLTRSREEVRLPAPVTKPSRTPTPPPLPTTDIQDYNRREQIRLRTWMAKFSLRLAVVVFVGMVILTVYLPVGEGSENTKVLSSLSELIGDIIKK